MPDTVISTAQTTMSMLFYPRSATFDASRKYRYLLTRELGPAPLPIKLGLLPGRWLAVVMLNPSVADGEHDDPTMRKVMGFARRWGFQRIRVVNLFARVSTDPRGLRPKAPDWIEPTGGPEADVHIINACQSAALVVCAWGRLPGRWANSRATDVAQLIGFPLYCLGTTADGNPRHPLMLAYDTPLQDYLGPA